jgi:hypothetical protein
MWLTSRGRDDGENVELRLVVAYALIALMVAAAVLVIRHMRTLKKERRRGRRRSF